MKAWKNALGAWVALTATHACGPSEPPSPDALRNQLLVAGTTALLRDSTLGLASSNRSARATLAWRVAGPGLDSASEATFERAVLRAVRGRVATTSDSAAEKLTVTGITARGDSGFLHIDRGALSCEGGTLLGAGSTYEYAFVRDGERWTVVRRRDEVAYDPAVPVPELVDRKACGRAMAR